MPLKSGFELNRGAERICQPYIFKMLVLFEYFTSDFDFVEFGILYKHDFRRIIICRNGKLS